MNAALKPDLPPVYIRDSKGKERMWSVTTEGANVVVSHGMVGGKIQEKVTLAKAKNIGKTNETTPEQQALLEAQSKWNHQVNREDYHQNIELAGRQLRPMLALDYNKVPHRVKWNEAIAQPKLDGLRLTVGNRLVPGGYIPGEFEMLTRKGEVYDVHHLVDPCNSLLVRVNQITGGRCIALDGEAYLHGMSLQQIVSRAKRYQRGLTEQLEFHLFDLVIPGMGFEERHAVLTEALFSCDYDPRLLQLVQCSDLEGEAHMKFLHGIYTQNGYEGLMIRHANSAYGIAQRSPDLFKYKHFHDDQFRIVDVWEDNNGNAMFTCEIFEGQKLTCHDHVATATATFGCTPKRTHVERKLMLVNKADYIGKWIKVKYQDLTDDKMPSFPVGLELRECDDHGNPLH